jgi:hypothetical protein
MTSATKKHRGAKIFEIPTIGNSGESFDEKSKQIYLLLSEAKEKNKIIQNFELFEQILQYSTVYHVLCFFEIFKANNLYHYIENFLHVYRELFLARPFLLWRIINDYHLPKEYINVYLSYISDCNFTNVLGYLKNHRMRTLSSIDMIFIIVKIRNSEFVYQSTPDYMISEFERLGFNLESVSLWEDFFEKLVEYHLTMYIPAFLKKYFNVIRRDEDLIFQLKTNRHQTVNFDTSKWTSELLVAIKRHL